MWPRKLLSVQLVSWHMVEKCNSATRNWLNLTPVLVSADVPSTQSKHWQLILPLLSQDVFGIWQHRQNILWWFFCSDDAGACQPWLKKLVGFIFLTVISSKRRLVKCKLLQIAAWYHNNNYKLLCDFAVLGYGWFGKIDSCESSSRKQLRFTFLLMAKPQLIIRQTDSKH